MKQLTIIILLTLFFGRSYGQIAARITAAKASSDAQLLAASPIAPFMPLQHKAINDSIYNIMLDVAGLVGSTGDLNTVLGLGNTSAIDVEIVDNGVEGEFYTKHMYNGVQTIHNPSGGGSEYPVTFLGRVAGNNVLYLRDAFSYFGYVGAGSLTADRKVLLPDEGDGVGLDATLVTHTTKDPITVDNGSTSTGTYGDGAAAVGDITGSICRLAYNQIDATITAGTAINQFIHDPKKLRYIYTNSVGSVVHTANLNFDRASFTGTTTQDLWFPSATNDTLAVKGDITAMGNFATADLTLTGNRYHNIDRYNVDIDSANMWTIQDTSGNYALNINDTANYSNSLIYASSRSDKTIRLSPIAATSPSNRLLLTNTASTSVAQIWAGSNQISLSQTSGICNINMATGNSVQVRLDSITKAVQISHLTSTGNVASGVLGTGAGTGATFAVNGGDVGGYITVTTGTGCATDAAILTTTFGQSFFSAPNVILTPANKATQNLAKGQEAFVDQATTTTTTFEITSNGTALTDATTYVWHYMIVQ